jgi:phage gp46-like protein
MSEVSLASRRRTRLANHLRERVAAGDRYFKSSDIGEKLDMSPKQVGSNLVFLSREIDDLAIEKWAQASKATTWLIQPAEPDDDPTVVEV